MSKISKKEKVLIKNCQEFCYKILGYITQDRMTYYNLASIALGKIDIYKKSDKQSDLAFVEIHINTIISYNTKNLLMDNKKLKFNMTTPLEISDKFHKTVRPVKVHTTRFNVASELIKSDTSVYRVSLLEI